MGISRIHPIPPARLSLSKVRSIAASSLVLMAGTVTNLTLFGASQSIAQTTAFTCNNIYVSVKSGAPTNNFPVGKEFYQLNWGDGTLGTKIGGDATGVTGGIGIDPTILKLIYYIDGNGGGGYNTDNNSSTPNVGKIWSFNGTTHTDTTHTIADPTAEHQAGMDLAGVLWSTKWNGNKNLYSYDKLGNAVSHGPITTSSANATEWNNLSEGDFVFDKTNKMWFVSTSGGQISIWTIDKSNVTNINSSTPVTITATKVSNYAPTGGSALSGNSVVTGGAFGPDGKLYIGTSLGDIFKFDISQTATGPVFLKTNTGKTITDMTSCMYPAINISGTVWNDLDNSAKNTFTNINAVSETGTNAGGLNAILVDGNNNVIATKPVAGDGTYSFNNISGNQTGLKIRLSTTAGTVGSTAPAASLPSGWEHSTPLETSAFDSGTINLSNKDFGINLITLSGIAFECDARFYQIRAIGTGASGYSELFRINRRANPYNDTQISNVPNLVLNSMGFNSQDNYLYAIYLGSDLNNLNGTIPDKGLYKIGQSGAQNLGDISGLPLGFIPTAGDFDNQGNLYITKSLASGFTDNQLYKINVSSKVATLLTMSLATPNLGDMSYNPTDNALYGVAGTGLYKIVPGATTAATSVTQMTGLGAVSLTAPAWGTTFFDGGGNFYAYANGTSTVPGILYFIDLTTNKATQLSTTPAATKSDGASCVFPPHKLTTTKSAGAVKRIDAKTFEIPYTITVASSGKAATYLQVTEDLAKTFPSVSTGNPTITILTTPSLSMTGAPLTPNPTTFNGTTNTNLLNGLDTLAVGASSTISFTVRVAYTNATDVPTTGITNSIYASTISTPPGNPGYQPSSTDPTVVVPPPDLLNVSVSSTTTTLPSANLVMVKRITAINGNRVKNDNDQTALNTYVPHAGSNDTNANWPTSPILLLGAYDGGKIKPGDKVEYTIYFMNANGTKAKNIKICDRIVGKQTFVSNAYGANQDIEYRLGTNPVRYLTKLSDTDRAQLNTSTSTIAGCPAPTDPTITGANNGTVIVDVTKPPITTPNADDLTEIPSASAPGTANSYGYIRFTTIVTP